MKILHTADWHLGRFLHGKNLLTDQAFLIDQILDIIQTHQVDAVLIAGDIYDRAIPSKEAVSLLNRFIQTLSEQQIPLVLISGNHDSAERLNFAAELLKQAELYILAELDNVSKPILLSKGDIRVNIYGIPFASPEIVRDAFNIELNSFNEAHSFLVKQITDSMERTENNLLISHCFVDGATESTSEKTLSIGGNGRVDYEPMLAFDYVALGHLHAPQKRGAETIRYAGSLAKYSFSEHHQTKSVTLVEFNRSGLTHIETIKLKPKRDVRILSGLLQDLIEQGKTDAKADDYIMARLHDDTALLDPVAKLRAVYPNLLHLEKSTFQTQPLASPNHKKESIEPLEMIKTFYQQSTGQPLSEKQHTILADLLKTLPSDSKENL